MEQDHATNETNRNELRKTLEQLLHAIDISTSRRTTPPHQSGTG